METTFFTSSPIGTLEIISDGEAINAVNFVEKNDWEENNIVPNLVQYCIAELQAYFKGELKDFSFPIAQKGTDFQQKVWAELTKIPYGTTTSYMELSRRIGDIKAIRAVGTTNGKNKLGIIVPCHRVIGSDGSLTGYAGGLWRKKFLLELERKVNGTGQGELF